MELSVWNVQSNVRVIRVLACCLDGSNSARGRERLFEAMEGARHVILDLEEVATIDDGGLSTLLELRTRAKTQGRTLILCRLAAQPSLAFHLLRLSSRFQLTDHLEGALRACGVVFPAPRGQLEAI